MASAERKDLSETPEFFLRLLDDTHAWRERLVEELDLGSAAHVRATSSYHVEFPPAQLEGHADPEEHRSVNVLLPLTTREKGPLLNLDLVGPGGSSAALTPRASIAALEAIYLDRLAQSSPAAEPLTPRIADGLLEAICLFTPARFVDHFLREAKGNRKEALRLYLEDGLAFPVSEENVASWQQLSTPIGRILVARLGELPSASSSSEEPLLALPLMDPRPTSPTQVSKVLDDFHAAVVDADAANDQYFLEALADYGRRFEVVVELELPLLEPAVVKLAEDRPLEISRRGWVTQRFSFGDARSAHLEARVTDPNVEIAAFDVRRLDGGGVGFGWIESARRTRETLSIYSSEENRPYYVDAWLRMKPALGLRLTSHLLTILVFAAAVTAASMPRDEVYVDRLALLAVPTTIAAAFVLARDQTTLASRLLALQRLFLGLVTLGLWVVVLIGITTYSGHSSETGRAKSEEAQRAPLSAPATSPKSTKPQHR